jgi:NADPH:quinone reductase-like Zn-dependent oxidoreductase
MNEEEILIISCISIVMKALLVRKPYGEENTVISEVPDPVPQKGEIVVKVLYAGLNPIDINVVRNKTVYGLKPDPHIPGSEISGIAESSGKNIKKGDRVILYSRWFDGTCKYCMSGREYLCSGGGIFGVLSNGGYCEKISVPEKMLLKIPDDVNMEDAVSVPVGGLTALHALNRTGAMSGQKLLVYGASGNTGLFAIILGKYRGMDVTAVSTKDWVKKYGASAVFSHDKIPVDLKADVVINSLGGDIFAESLDHVAPGGKIATFGVFNGANVQLNLAKIYTQEHEIIGSTGGTYAEMNTLIGMMQDHSIKLPTDRVFGVDHLKEAIQAYSGRTNGRILLKIQ